MDSDTAYWVRWIALVCAILGFVMLVMTLRFYTIARINRGHEALAGTSWLVPTAHHPQRQQPDEIPAVAAPPYNPEMGEHDAGYYDIEGNFVSKQVPQYSYESVHSAQSIHSSDPAEPERAHQRPAGMTQSDGLVVSELAPTYSASGNHHEITEAPRNNGTLPSGLV